MTHVVAAIQPLIMNIVTVAVTAATNKMWATVSENRMQDIERMDKTIKELNTLKKNMQLHKFELDKIEQYSRKDNIRINGIEQNENENTNDIIKQLASDIGIAITDSDISVSHRLPGRPGSTKPIIVKFVRRDMKTQMMKNKRKLKDAGRRNVYLNDDLTPLRAKITRIMRSETTINSVWTIDGRIFCTVTDNGNDVKKTIDSPDDLFKLGWSEAKIKDLDLYIKN